MSHLSDIQSAVMPNPRTSPTPVLSLGHGTVGRRFYLEIEGKQRFKVVECWEQDGYRVARPGYFADTPPPTASEAQASLQALCQSVDQLANVWLDKVR